MSVYIEDTFSPDVPSIFLRPKWPTASVYLTAFVTDNIFNLSSKKLGRHSLKFDFGVKIAPKVL